MVGLGRRQVDQPSWPVLPGPMAQDRHQLALAAQFCRDTGKPDLLAYLGLPRTCAAEEALEALKQRRRYLQGMQANPKYKHEALGLIKSYAAFQALLADLDAYRASVPAPTITPSTLEPPDPTPPSARRRATELSEPPQRAPIARPIAQQTTAPTVRRIELADAPTAPPVRERTSKPKTPSPAAPVEPRVRIDGDRLRQVVLRTHGDLRLRVHTPRPATVTCEEEWMSAAPARLDAGASQLVTIAIDPRRMTATRLTGTIIVRTDDGEAASTIVFVERLRDPRPYLLAAAAAVALIVAIVMWASLR